MRPPSSELLREQQCVHEVHGHQQADREADDALEPGHAARRRGSVVPAADASASRSGPMIRSQARTKTTASAKKATSATTNRTSGTAMLLSRFGHQALRT